MQTKREDPSAVKVTMKNGKPALKGKCPVCGTGMYKIGAANFLEDPSKEIIILQEIIKTPRYIVNLKIRGFYILKGIYFPL